jgi:hypothetical protein
LKAQKRPPADVEFTVEKQGCTLNENYGNSSIDVCFSFEDSLSSPCSQFYFIAIKDLSFVSGLPKDKTVFAVVHEQKAGVNTCSFFKSKESVCSVLSFLVLFLTHIGRRYPSCKRSRKP